MRLNLEFTWVLFFHIRYFKRWWSSNLQKVHVFKESPCGGVNHHKRGHQPQVHRVPDVFKVLHLELPLWAVSSRTTYLAFQHPYTGWLHALLLASWNINHPRNSRGLLSTAGSITLSWLLKSVPSLVPLSTWEMPPLGIVRYTIKP